MNKFLIFPFFIFLLFAACNKNKDQYISAEFESYVDAFFSEARKRGENLHLSDYNLSIKLVEIEQSNIEGNCKNYKITIDKTHWELMDVHQRRLLVFHEMGHCILDRRHKNDITSMGLCKSIMRSLENDFECSIDIYSQIWWDYYLDELFNESTELPEWASEDKNMNLIQVFENVLDTLIGRSRIDFENMDSTEILEYLDSLASENSGPSQFRLKSVDFNNLGNFRVEFVFNDWSFTNSDAQFYFGDIAFVAGKNSFHHYVEIKSSDLRNIYFTTENFSIGKDVVLSVVRQDEYLNFFLDKKYIHSIEDEVILSNELYLDLYVNPININLSIDKIK